jgi:ADP-ribosylglycohydrolase
MQEISRASGCLFGMALGDALGAETEFLSVPDIIKRFPPDGPRQLKGNPARVTDDTQMALAVARALINAERPLSAATLESPLRGEFVSWLNSPDNNRSPGYTCLSACAGLERGLPWIEATVEGSKGCGANMRVAPVGLLNEERDGITPRTRAAVAQFQAALTHGHPTALTAADLTAAAIDDLMTGGGTNDMANRLREYAISQREVYHEEWLGALWQRPGINSPAEFISRGWDECLVVLDRLEIALAAPDRESDPCLATGAGWVAEEALATGLLCFLLYPERPLEALHRAAVSSGDSDSIASLTGAFAGAYLGPDAWPQVWLDCIEYKEDLQSLGAIWD